MSSIFVCLTDNNKTTHWVGRAKLKLLYKDDYHKRKIIDDIQDILTGTTIEQSTSGRKKNLYLLQGDKEKYYEEANYYADVNAEANKIYGENSNIIITM